MTFSSKMKVVFVKLNKGIHKEERRMKKNPVVPYALIAVIGIALVIVISIAGIHQRDDIQKAEEGGETQEQKGAEEGEGGETTDPEAIFKQNCSSCHGEDLSGGMGPNLQDIGSKHSKDEIEGIIEEGPGQMPPGLIEGDPKDAVAEWLAEKK